MAPKCRCRDSFQIREGADGPLEVTVMLTFPVSCHIMTFTVDFVYVFSFHPGRTL